MLSEITLSICVGHEFKNFLGKCSVTVHRRIHRTNSNFRRKQAPQVTKPPPQEIGARCVFRFKIVIVFFVVACRSNDFIFTIVIKEGKLVAWESRARTMIFSAGCHVVGWGRVCSTYSDARGNCSRYSNKILHDDSKPEVSFQKTFPCNRRDFSVVINTI